MTNANLIPNKCAHSINGVLGLLSASKKWVSETRPVSGYGKGARMNVQIRFDADCRKSFSVTADIMSIRGEEASGCLHEEVAAFFPELAHLLRWHLCDANGPMYYIENTIYHVKSNGPTHAWVYYTGASDPLNIGETRARLVGYVKADEAKTAEGQPRYEVRWDDKTSKVANLEFARRNAVWPDATDEELTAPPEVLETALRARLPALLAAMRADIEAAGFRWECPTTESA